MPTEYCNHSLIVIVHKPRNCLEQFFIAFWEHFTIKEEDYEITFGQENILMIPQYFAQFIELDILPNFKSLLILLILFFFFLIK